jgi:hypothetical protein
MLSSVMAPPIGRLQRPSKSISEGIERCCKWPEIARHRCQYEAKTCGWDGSRIGECLRSCPVLHVDLWWTSLSKMSRCQGRVPDPDEASSGTVGPCDATTRARHRLVAHVAGCR